MSAIRHHLKLIVAAVLIGVTTVSVSPSSSGHQDENWPQIKSTIPPTIPRQAVRLPFVPVAGKIIIDLKVNGDGIVTSSHAIEGNHILRKATEDSVLGWRLAP